MEIFNNINNVIILYAPTVLVYVSQLIDWIVTLKKFKALDIKKQVSPVLAEVHNCTKELRETNDRLDNLETFKKDCGEIFWALKESVEARDKELEEIKECLKNLSEENIRLKAELSKKK